MFPPGENRRVYDTESFLAVLLNTSMYAPDRLDEMEDFLPPEFRLNLTRAFDELIAGVEFSPASKNESGDVKSQLAVARQAYESGEQERGARLLMSLYNDISKRG